MPIKTKTLPSPEVLRDLFDYDPESGILTRRKTGMAAGEKNERGYLRVKIKQKHYRVHRVVWAWWYGRHVDEGYFIDHIDRNPSNNRITNLRIVTTGDNCRNTSKAINAELRRREKSGIKKRRFLDVAKYVTIAYPDGETLTVPSVEKAAQVLGIKSLPTITRACERQSFRFNRLQGITLTIEERTVLNPRATHRVKTKTRITKKTRRIR